MTLGQYSEILFSLLNSLYSSELELKISKNINSRLRKLAEFRNRLAHSELFLGLPNLSELDFFKIYSSWPKRSKDVIDYKRKIIEFEELYNFINECVALRNCILGVLSSILFEKETTPPRHGIKIDSSGNAYQEGFEKIEIPTRPPEPYAEYKPSHVNVYLPDFLKLIGRKGRED